MFLLKRPATIIVEKCVKRVVFFYFAIDGTMYSSKQNKQVRKKTNNKKVCRILIYHNNANTNTQDQIVQLVRARRIDYISLVIYNPTHHKLFVLVLVVVSTKNIL